MGDMILVRERGVLTPAEKQLAKSDEGIRLIKQIRVKLVENSRDLLATLIKDITGVEVVALHTDISTSAGERVFVFSLDGNLEAMLERVRRLSKPSVG